MFASWDPPYEPNMHSSIWPLLLKVTKRVLFFPHANKCYRRVLLCLVICSSQSSSPQLITQSPNFKRIKLAVLTICSYSQIWRKKITRITKAVQSWYLSRYCMYFLSNFRTFCIISFTDIVSLGTCCENFRTLCVRFCTNVEISNTVWKTKAFH